MTCVCMCSRRVAMMGELVDSTRDVLRAALRSSLSLSLSLLSRRKGFDAKKVDWARRDGRETNRKKRNYNRIGAVQGIKHSGSNICWDIAL